MVEIIVANNAAKKIPLNPLPNALSAYKGNESTGLDKFGKAALAYNPVVVVKKSNNAMNSTEINIPHLAVLPSFAA